MTPAPEVTSQTSTTAVALLVCIRCRSLCRYRGDRTGIVIVLARTQDRILLVLAGKWREYLSRKLEAYALVEVDEVLVPSSNVDVAVAALFDSDEIFL